MKNVVFKNLDQHQMCASESVKRINLRNGLETQTKVQMLLMLHPWYGLIRFTLEPRNFTLMYFSTFYLHILNKNGDVYATIDFRNLSASC